MFLVLGPVVAGAIYQKYNSYEYAYYQSGIACFMCGFIQLFYPTGELLKYFCNIFKKLRQSKYRF